MPTFNCDGIQTFRAVQSHRRYPLRYFNNNFTHFDEEWDRGTKFVKLLREDENKLRVKGCRVPGQSTDEVGPQQEETKVCVYSLVVQPRR